MPIAEKAKVQRSSFNNALPRIKSRLGHQSVKLDILSASNNNDLSDVDAASPANIEIDTKFINSPLNDGQLSPSINIPEPTVSTAQRNYRYNSHPSHDTSNEVLPATTINVQIQKYKANQPVSGGNSPIQVRTTLTKLANDQREKALLSLGTGIVGESISPKQSEIDLQKSRQMKLPCLPPKRASQTMVHSAMNKTTQVKQSIVNLNPYRALVTPIINVSKHKVLQTSPAASLR